VSAPKPRVADEKGTFANLKDVKVQKTAKRALEIAAAGGHNMLLLKSICPNGW
jgi:magnesium chelatase family protein